MRFHQSENKRNLVKNTLIHGELQGVLHCSRKSLNRERVHANDHIEGLSHVKYDKLPKRQISDSTCIFFLLMMFTIWINEMLRKYFSLTVFFLNFEFWWWKQNVPILFYSLLPRGINSGSCLRVAMNHAIFYLSMDIACRKQCVKVEKIEGLPDPSGITLTFHPAPVLRMVEAFVGSVNWRGFPVNSPSASEAQHPVVMSIGDWRTPLARG